MKKIILPVLAILTLNTQAAPNLVYSNTQETFKAVVNLRSYSGTCTGAVVGLNPPTVITARHCTEMGVSNFENISPEKIIDDEFKDLYFSVYAASLPGDLAILIYPKTSLETFKKVMKEEDLFSVKTMPLVHGQSIEMCGFGGSTPGHSYPSGIGTQRCGFNNIVMENKKLDFMSEMDEYIKNNPDANFAKLSSELQTKWIHANIQNYLTEFESGTRYAIGALDMPAVRKEFMGSYDEAHKYSLIQQGDSGGPGFIKDKDGQKYLIGVNSAAGYAPMTSQLEVVFGIFWRLDHSWSRDLMKRAIKEGADIKGFEK